MQKKTNKCNLHFCRIFFFFAFFRFFALFLHFSAFYLGFLQFLKNLKSRQNHLQKMQKKTKNMQFAIFCIFVRIFFKVAFLFAFFCFFFCTFSNFRFLRISSSFYYISIYHISNQCQILKRGESKIGQKSILWKVFLGGGEVPPLRVEIRSQGFWRSPLSFGKRSLQISKCLASWATLCVKVLTAKILGIYHPQMASGHTLDLYILRALEQWWLKKEIRTEKVLD